jgi:hypothetical protein
MLYQEFRRYLEALDDLDAAHEAAEEAQLAGTMTVRLKDAIIRAESRVRALERACVKSKMIGISGTSVDCQ